MDPREATPEVTIGMPVFNDVKFIEASLKSLLAQTFTNFKLIISDDGSTDGSAEICKKYTQQDKRITYIRQEKNIGISKNMMFLLEQATSEFFMWAGDDDLWDPNYIEQLVTLLQKNKDSVSAFCSYSDIDENGDLLNTTLTFDYSDNNNFAQLKKFIAKSDDALGYGLFRREKILGIKFPIWWWPNKNNAYNNIYPTICFYLTKGRHHYIAGKPLFFNRVKSPQLINHKLPFPEDSFRGLIAFCVRKFNLAVCSLNMVCKAGNLFTALRIKPFLLWQWQIKPSYYQTKHYLKLLLNLK